METGKIDIEDTPYGTYLSVETQNDLFRMVKHLPSLVQLFRT